MQLFNHVNRGVAPVAPFSVGQDRGFGGWIDGVFPFREGNVSGGRVELNDVNC